MSEVFKVSLDKLIKGDVDVMKDVIQKEEVDKMNHYGKIYTIMLIVTVVSVVPLFMWLGFWAFIPWGIIWMISMYFASKIEKLRKIMMFKPIRKLWLSLKENYWMIYINSKK